jgi:CspA family cold shock protein
MIEHVSIKLHYKLCTVFLTPTLHAQHFGQIPFSDLEFGKIEHSGSGAGWIIMHQMEPKEPQAGPRISDQTEYHAGHPATDVIKLAGVIKWFDVARGYGFIVPDNGMSDILLDARCLRHGGFHIAYEGMRAVVEVLRGPRGLQAFRILTMDVLTAVTPPPPHLHTVIKATSDLERAQVKWFNQQRGFGFLTRGKGTPDIFVHLETLRQCGLVELRPGQVVLVRFGYGPKGLMAAEVRPDDSSLGTAVH